MSKTELSSECLRRRKAIPEIVRLVSEKEKAQAIRHAVMMDEIIRWRV